MPTLTINQPDLTPGEMLTLLQEGAISTLHGLLPWGSNHTFLLTMAYAGAEALVVYKPQAGERPLWDFPDGTLCLREQAAFVLSEALGWGIVPPTVIREDAPHGLGSLQFFVDHDPEENYFTFGARHVDAIRRIALFDVIANNADRKGGHCLLGRGGHIWAIDHGLCFHAYYKLRTVIWDFAGDRIPAALAADIGRLCEKLEEPALVDALRELLSEREIDALRARTARLVQSGLFPLPGAGRSYPWPPV